MISDKDLKTIRERFERYVETFTSLGSSHQENILLKKDHSLRVSDNSLLIGKALGLQAGERCLAETIGLLHDIGRFEQYARYRTFADSKSINHAELGVRIIENSGMLAGMAADLKEMVMRPILYHNRARLPENESRICRFFSQLIRDADKLDIWNVTTRYYLQRHAKRNTLIELGLEDSAEITPAVLHNLRRHRIVDIENLNTLNDFKLFQVGWVFDLNFVPTIRETIKRGHLEKMRAVLPDSREIEDIFATVADYMKKRILAAEAAA